MDFFRNFFPFGFDSAINAENILLLAPFVVFNANRCNICHLFKELSRVLTISTEFPLNYRNYEKLLNCSGCKLMFYCSPEHQKLDWKIHKDFCRSIQKCLKIFNVDHPHNTPCECREIDGLYYKRLKPLIEKNLNRTMDPNEMLCLTFTRSCANCNDFKPKEKFLSCEKCNAVVYCTAQCKKNDFSDHKTICDELKLVFSSFRYPFTFDFFEFEFESVQRTIDMLKTKNLTTFLQNYLPNKIEMNGIPKHQVQLEFFKFLGKFSRTATLIFSMQICKILKKCEERIVIHIIKNVFEISDEFVMDEYKLLLSQMPKVKKLVIVYIGEKLTVFGKVFNKENITFQNKKIEIETHFQEGYKNLLVDSKFGHINKPHFVMWFNTSFAKLEDPNLLLLANCLFLHEIPFGYTSYAYDVAVFNKEIVENISKALKKTYETIMVNYKNPFKGDVPIPIRGKKISTMHLNYYLDIIIPKTNI